MRRGGKEKKRKIQSSILLTKKFQPFNSSNAFSLVTCNLFNNNFRFLLDNNPRSYSTTWIFSQNLNAIAISLVSFLYRLYRIVFNYLFLYLSTRKTFDFLWLWCWSIAKKLKKRHSKFKFASDGQTFSFLKDTGSNNIVNTKTSKTTLRSDKIKRFNHKKKSVRFQIYRIIQ